MKIVDILTCFISSIWLPILFYFIFKNKIERKRLNIGILICTIVVFLGSLILTNEIGFIIICVIIAIIFIKIFRCKKRQLLYIPISYIIVVIYNYIVELIFYKLGYAYGEYEMSSQMDIAQMLCITLMVYITAVFISYLEEKFKNRYYINIDKELIVLIGVNLVLCMLVFLINGWAARKAGFTNTVVRNNLLIFGGYMFLTLIISIVIFKVFADRQKMRREKEQYENLKEYTTQIETMYQSIRAFKHDYVNILTSIAGYLEAEKYEELNTYFNDNILKESRKLTQDDFKLNMLSNIKEPGLKGLISSKLIYAHEIGIKVVIDILDEVEEFYINIFDLNRIMGIFLDNAIEAANECKENKEIRFNVIKEEKEVVITLMNTFEVDEVDINNIEKNGYSTKGENRGLGLYNVKEILKKYRSVLKSTSVQDGFFVQSLVLQK